jgi:hypothetical protein
MKSIGKNPFFINVGKFPTIGHFGGPDGKFVYDNM